MRRDAQAQVETVREQAQRAAQDLQSLTGSEAATAAAQRDALLAEARNRADELLQRSQRHADERAEQTVAAAEQEVLGLREELDRLRLMHQHAVEQARETAQQLLGLTDPTQVDVQDATEVPS